MPVRLMVISLLPGGWIGIGQLRSEGPAKPKELLDGEDPVSSGDLSPKISDERVSDRLVSAANTLVCIFSRKILLILI